MPIHACAAFQLMNPSGRFRRLPNPSPQSGPVHDLGLIIDDPTHVYTKALLSAIPIPDPTVKRSRLLLKGETPTARVLLAGCPLQDRCELVLEECRQPVPEYDLGDGHRVACRLAREHAGYRPAA
jgi:oligopeptide/dipeptide ABC transporter ATP-binding protein